MLLLSRFLAILLCAVAPIVLEAAQKPRPTSALDQAIEPVMQKFVQDGVISGAVTLVSDAKSILSLKAVGSSDLATQRPMRPDDLFWIASMTKPITAVAVLMLQDEGKLTVDDPVEKHLPEFKNLWLIKEQSKETRQLVPAPRPITIHDLLTHTSGLGDVSAPRYDSTLAELVMAYSQQPLRFPPGTKWEYSNAGINTLGRLVEVLSGLSYAQFVQQRILNPLGMKDTTFWPTPAQTKRIAKSYKPAKDGKGLEEVANNFIKGGISDRRRTAVPAGGLFSTASDMATFYQMMLRGGIFDGHRMLSENTANALTRTQTGEIKTGFVDGMSWGFGFQVVKNPEGVTAMLSEGTFGHGGAYATQSWADPVHQRIMILMIQRAGFPNGDNSPVRQAFQQAASSVGK